MVMRNQFMETVALGPRIAGTTAAVYNKLYKNDTMKDLRLRISAIENLRHNCGLDIPHRDIIIFKPIRGRTLGTFFSNTGKIFVDPRRTTREIISTVAHELVHEEQYHTGKFAKQFINGQWISEWKGVRYNQPRNYAEYFAFPWEVEARARQDELATMAMKDLS